MAGSEAPPEADGTGTAGIADAGASPSEPPTQTARTAGQAAARGTTAKPRSAKVGTGRAGGSGKSAAARTAKSGSAKTGTARSAKTATAKTAAARPAKTATAKTAAARPAKTATAKTAAAKTATARPAKTATGRPAKTTPPRAARTPGARPGNDVSPPPRTTEKSPGALETAVQAAAELTEIGLHASARALRRTLSRLSR